MNDRRNKRKLEQSDEALIALGFCLAKPETDCPDIHVRQTFHHRIDGFQLFRILRKKNSIVSNGFFKCVVLSL